MPPVTCRVLHPVGAGVRPNRHPVDAGRLPLPHRPRPSSGGDEGTARRLEPDAHGLLRELGRNLGKGGVHEGAASCGRSAARVAHHPGNRPHALPIKHGLRERGRYQGPEGQGCARQESSKRAFRREDRQRRYPCRRDDRSGTAASSRWPNSAGTEPVDGDGTGHPDRGRDTAGDGIHRSPGSLSVLTSYGEPAADGRRAPDASPAANAG